MSNSTVWESANATTKYSVHLGTWINWSRGAVMGATLTTTRQDGNLLIALTAFFVSFISSRFWHIACFVLHRCYSTTEPQDALHHQRQAVFRNSGSSASGFMMLAQLAWAWRSSARRCLFRMLPAILTAALFISVFTAAGGFSSRISSGVGNEVLLDGSNCAHRQVPENSTIETGIYLNSKMAQDIEDAANYAQQCYSNDRSGMLDCTSFVKDHLPSTADTQAPCPFTGGICRSSSSNLRLDTGLLDSNDFFGLNGPRDQRIFFRQVLQCAPLITEPFVQNSSTSSGNFTTYNYGHNRLGENFTYSAKTMEEQYPKRANNVMSNSGSNFVLITYSAYANDITRADESDFVPIAQLNRTDGDLHLVFLMGNGVYFFEETTDPWYRGTVPGGNVTSSQANNAQVVYRPEDAASPMGCVEQYQFCNADKECGALTGTYDAVAQAAPYFNTTAFDVQDGTTSDPIGSRFQWYFHAINDMSLDLDSMLLNLGPNALVSQQSLLEGYLGPLSENQWQLDVIHWWATRLASIQAAFVNTAYGTADPSTENCWASPSNSYMREMCNNQKILSTEYTSFSLFGLYFTYISGLLITLASFALEPVFACLDRRGKEYRQYKHLEWTATETLQLQRLAYQGIKSGTWSGYTDSVPMTKPRETLDNLPASYQVPRSGSEEGQDQGQRGLKPMKSNDTSGCSDNGDSVATTITPGDADHGSLSEAVKGTNILSPCPSPPTLWPGSAEGKGSWSPHPSPLFAQSEPTAEGIQLLEGAGAVGLAQQQPAGSLLFRNVDATAARPPTAAMQPVARRPADGPEPPISQPSMPVASFVLAPAPFGNA